MVDEASVRAPAQPSSTTSVEVISDWVRLVSTSGQASATVARNSSRQRRLSGTLV